MQEPLAATTVSVGVDVPFEDVYRFLADPANFAAWASGLSGELTQDGDVWRGRGPDGPISVSFTAPNDFGVLDHVVHVEPGVEVAIPMRVVPNGEGSEVMLTIFRSTSMTDETYERDVAWVRRDLAALASLLIELF